MSAHTFDLYDVMAAMLAAEVAQQQSATQDEAGVMVPDNCEDLQVNYLDACVFCFYLISKGKSNKHRGCCGQLHHDRVVHFNLCRCLQRWG